MLTSRLACYLAGQGFTHAVVYRGVILGKYRSEAAAIALHSQSPTDAVVVVLPQHGGRMSILTKRSV